MKVPTYIPFEGDSDTDYEVPDSHNSTSETCTSDFSGFDEGGTAGPVQKTTEGIKSILKPKCSCCLYEKYLEGEQDNVKGHIGESNYERVAAAEGKAASFGEMVEGISITDVPVLSERDSSFSLLDYDGGERQAEFWEVLPVAHNFTAPVGVVSPLTSGNLARGINGSPLTQRADLGDCSLFRTGSGGVGDDGTSVSSPTVGDCSSEGSEQTVEQLEQFIDGSFKGFVREHADKERGKTLSRLQNHILREEEGPTRHSIPENGGRHTRSQGPVRDLVHVQPKILERPGAQ